MNNVQLINAGIKLIGQGGKQGAAAANNTAVIQRIDNGRSQLAAYLITEPQAVPQQDQANLLELAQKIETGFNENELRDLCFRLQMDYENVAGQTKRDKIRELVLLTQRHSTLDELVAAAAVLRPRMQWQTAVQTREGTPIVSKLDMVVIVDVARSATGNAAQYLDTRGVSANFVLLRHVQPGAFFSVNDNWQQLIITFGEVMDQVKREFAGAHLHFFMAGPGALLFSMGCVWGTVDEAVVYHYEESTYHPVLKTSREMRHVTTGWS
ncbi:MAG: SAVED domain-containing protein [Anaerolineae bacterium]|nr:SAVED domain-containing protein [Anaerolineae bacterium]